MIVSSSSFRSKMAILSGNFISTSAIQLQNHVFQIPWVRKKMMLGTISCSNGRRYSKSVPVRYIPKKSSENEQSQVSSSLPKSQSNDIKQFESVELSKSKQKSSNSRSFVAGTKFQKQHENPISRINYNEGYDTRVSQSNLERIQLGGGSEMSYISRISDVGNEFQNENREPLSNVSDSVGVGTSSDILSNVERLEPTAQASSSSWSFFSNSKLENQSEIVQPDLERNKTSKIAQTSCSSRQTDVEPQFPNFNERSTNDAEHENELGVGGSDISDLPRIALSESVHTSFGDRSVMADIESQYQNKNAVEKVKYNVCLVTNRVVPSNAKKVDHSNSNQTLCSGKSFVLNTEGLGVEEEFDGDVHFQYNESMEEFEDLSNENSREGHGLRGVKVKEDVRKLAVELLAMRALTALELRKKLQGKNFPLRIVDSVIKDFKARGLINDGLYAETYSRSRWSSSTWGPRRIKRALYSKGVSEVEADKAVKLVFNDASASVGQESALGMSKVSMDHLFAQASKQWMRSSDLSIEKRKTRIVWWLQYRGFGWSTISIVLKKLESTPPT